MILNINNHKVHVQLSGNPTEMPPVVVVTGTGSWSYEWELVQEELSKHTQVLTYDRPGYGWSDASADGFSIDETIMDLKAILDETNIDEPVILVGHSQGGIYTRLFADKYPDRVAGLILVDTRNEFFSKEVPDFTEKFFATQSQAMNKLLSKIGVVRLVGENILPESLPEFISREKHVNVHWDSDFFTVLDQEINQILTSEEMVAKTKPLGDKPVTIITPDTNHSSATSFGFSAEEEAEINNHWRDAQQQLTNLSTNSEFVLIPDSSHAVMYDQPEAIVESVIRMGKGLELVSP
ncbi:alpha/beta fold hydrolase [Metabacillus herbersteinensis]|uniref:Alpha/beta fold hydrolase n=1 Tax=Metabacillus herbersteinensis TaxID=283816 RepID=A0ABV6GHS1_9BACI